MSIETYDLKNYLKKLELEDLEGVLSNEDLQNCIMTVSAMDDEETLSKGEAKSKLDMQSVSSSELGEVKKLTFSNLNVKSLLSG